MLTADGFAQAYSGGVTKTARFLLSRGLSWDLAQEVAQAAWVRGWERRAQLRDPDTLGVWVNSIALNLFRTEQRHPFHPLPRHLLQPSHQLDHLDVERLLARCSPKERVLLGQRYFEEQSAADMAAHWGGCPPATIRIQLFRALAKLRNYVDGSSASRR